MAIVARPINMSFRVDKELKQNADKLFKNLGLNTSIAINIFLTQCVREQAIPFKPYIKKPTVKLAKALEELDKIEAGKIKPKKYKSFNAVLEDL